MTTIAYRDGVLAADSRAYSGDKTPIGSKTKIHRLADGSLLGVSTRDVGGDAVIRAWVEAGCPAPQSGDLRPSEFDALRIMPTGEVYYACGNLAWTGPLSAEYFAIGSGDQFALGAMAMGATAEEAVQAAIGLDPWSSGPVTILSRAATA